MHTPRYGYPGTVPGYCTRVYGYDSYFEVPSTRRGSRNLGTAGTRYPYPFQRVSDVNGSTGTSKYQNNVAKMLLFFSHTTQGRGGAGFISHFSQTIIFYGLVSCCRLWAD